MLKKIGSQKVCKQGRDKYKIYDKYTNILHMKANI